MAKVTEYELGKIRTDKGEFLDKGNFGIDPAHPDFASVRDIRNGAADARDAFALADTFAQLYGLELRLSPGVYAFASNITIASPVRFVDGAVLKPASGVTITFSNAVTYGGNRQIFDLSAGGVLAGIKTLNPMWLGATGDATADDSSIFSKLITAAPTKAIISKVHLIGGITLPSTMTLEFVDGGRLKFKTGTTTTVQSPNNAGQAWIYENSTEVAADLPEVRIHNGQRLWITNFGGKGDGLDASKTLNYNALRACWNAGGRESAAKDGVSIGIPAGVFQMTKFELNVDGVGSPSSTTKGKYCQIRGEGKRKSTLRLADSQNTGLFHARGAFDFDVLDVGFDGNDTNNASTAADTPLVYFGNYRIGLYNILVEEAASDGLQLRGTQMQAAHLSNVASINVAAWGLVIDGGLAISLDGLMDIESCGTGGVRIKNEEARTVLGGSLRGSWYMEGVPIAFQLEGVRNYRLAPVVYVPDTTTLARLKLDASSNPSTGNTIDASGVIQSSTSQGSWPIVVIDAGCGGNHIIGSEKTQVNDQTVGANANSWGAVATTSPFEKSLAGSVAPSNLYFADSHPCAASMSDAAAAVAGNIFANPALAHVGSSVSFGRLTAGSQWRELLGTNALAQSTTYYLYVLARGKNTHMRVQIIDIEPATDVYHILRSDTTTTTATQNPIPLSGGLQFFRFPFTTSANDNRYDFRVSCGRSGVDSVGGPLDLFYVMVSDHSDMGLVHRRTSAIVGTGMNVAYYTNTNRPTASQVPIGTVIFNTSDNFINVSDGTNWKDPTGATT